ncbi:hypothetical protein TWF730_002292 [Orbilia blumenaviensis]|uniref:DUF4219 domain-containing protein n=1 Tax=Orbilia blumenaviensis TaxID=1796055 RepID=A0AAV9UA71_9PEZI
MSEEQPYTTTYTPKTYTLVGGNYLEWSIHMERCIERFRWKHMLESPHDADSYEEDDEAAEDLLKRNECSTFIIENINTKYWFLFDPRERDPYFLWARIKSVWLPKNPEVAEIYASQIRCLFYQTGGIRNYIAEARMYWEKYKEAGGKEFGETEVMAYLLEGITETPYRATAAKLRSVEKEVDFDYALIMLEAAENAFILKGKAGIREFHVSKIKKLSSSGVSY